MRVRFLCLGQMLCAFSHQVRRHWMISCRSHDEHPFCTVPGRHLCVCVCVYVHVCVCVAATVTLLCVVKPAVTAKQCLYLLNGATYKKLHVHAYICKYRQEPISHILVLYSCFLCPMASCHKCNIINYSHMGCYYLLKQGILLHHGAWSMDQSLVLQ